MWQMTTSWPAWIHVHSLVQSSLGQKMVMALRAPSSESKVKKSSILSSSPEAWRTVCLPDHSLSGAMLVLEFVWLKHYFPCCQPLEVSLSSQRPLSGSMWLATIGSSPCKYVLLRLARERLSDFPSSPKWGKSVPSVWNDFIPWNPSISRAKVDTWMHVGSYQIELV